MCSQYKCYCFKITVIMCDYLTRKEITVSFRLVCKRALNENRDIQITCFRALEFVFFDFPCATKDL